MSPALKRAAQTELLANVAVQRAREVASGLENQLRHANAEVGRLTGEWFHASEALALEVKLQVDRELEEASAHALGTVAG